ncbi:hypothetical protein VCB98_13430 [Gammaproteobacteria bacterium AB-CW1]|uniref:Uncharacterized protein n=1 Tax=Natronospira elongata TaxID=3110268 RepID=A0AAP6JGV9_9GAMM|nr:hypothetical protein [Gammaproteobacteria bacterium AB-CW1]
MNDAMISAWEKLRRSDTVKGLPEFRASGLEMEHETIQSHEALIQQLEAFEPTAGWLQCQSRQWLFRDGLPDMKSAAEQHGELLSAEAVNDRGQSLAIRQDARGGWHLTRLTPEAEGPYLCDTVSHRAATEAGQHLHYRRYWRHDKDLGFRPFTAGLIGLGGEQ